MKRLLCSVLILLSFCLLVACGNVPMTTAAESTTDSEAITTAPMSEMPPTKEEIAENTFAQTGLELALTVCRMYYDLERHELAHSLTERSNTVIWYLASYIEMLAEAHRLFPDNDEIERYYIDALDECLPLFLVEDASFQVLPTGKVFFHKDYYNAGAGGKGDFYYDDNAWVALLLLDAYEQFGKTSYLTLAENTLDFIWTGWDTRYGGLFWDKTFTGKGSGNAPSAALFAMAYQITGKKVYLDRAETIYAWCNTMLRNDKGLYHAGIVNIEATEFDKNNLDPWIAAYDQGTMLMAQAMLYKATENDAFFQDLKRTASRTLQLTFKGHGEMNGNPIYKSWGIGWLLRGEIWAERIGGEPFYVKAFMRSMEVVLTKELSTKDENGHYDPFFMTGEWWPPTDAPDTVGYDHEVIQPAGVAIIYLLMAQYQLYGE